MKKLLAVLIIGLSINCVSFAIDNNIQISDKYKKLYQLRQNAEYGLYAGDMSMYNADYTNKADNFLQKGDLEKANKYINLAIYYYDSNPLTYVIKSELDLLNNDIECAKANFDKVFDILGNDVDKYDSRSSLIIRIDKLDAKIAMAEKDYNKASDIIDEIRERWTTFDNEVIKLDGECLILNGKSLNNEDSIKAGQFLINASNMIDRINIAIKKNPNNSENYYQKAILQYELLKENKFALANVNKALELSKQSKYLLLKSQLVTDKETQLNLINEAIKLSPVNNADVYGAKANYYYKRENYERALQDYLKALKYGGNEEDYADQLGWCYYEQENFEQSLKYFVISNNIGGQADSLLNLGKYKEALELYKKIVDNSDYDQDVVKSNMAICKQNLK